MKTRFHVISLGALAALGATAAQAQSSVTIYGIAAVEAVRVTNVITKNAAGAVVRKENLYKLDNSQDTSSRLGFKGSEDLGNGLNAVFGLESGIDLDTGSQQGTFWNRGSYVGLSSKSLGTLTFGRQWNVNDDIMANYFVFDGYSVYRFRKFDYLSDLMNNAIKYVSPNLGGLTIRGLVAAGEGDVANFNSANGGRTTEVAATYAYGPLNAGASYRYVKRDGDPDKLAAGGVSYTIGDFRPHIGYAESVLAGGPKAKAYDGGVTWAATPQLSFDFDYVANDEVDNGNDSHFYRLKAAYFLSKRTSFLANVVALKNKGAADERFYGDGAAGVDQNVFSLGLRHTF